MAQVVDIIPIENKNQLYYIVNIIAANALVTQGARALTTMVLT